MTGGCRWGVCEMPNSGSRASSSSDDSCWSPGWESGLSALIRSVRRGVLDVRNWLRGKLCWNES